MKMNFAATYIYRNLSIMHTYSYTEFQIWKASKSVRNNTIKSIPDQSITCTSFIQQNSVLSGLYYYLSIIIYLL